MTDAELQHYRERLETQAARLREDVVGLHQEALRGLGGATRGNLSNVPLHTADLGSDAFEHETSLGLLEAHNQHLDSVRAALQRISEGKYGRCRRCGGDIPKGRLDALPEALSCLSCAQQLEDRSPLVESPGNL
jgi:DnaK suppressor protein